MKKFGVLTAMTLGLVWGSGTAFAHGDEVHAEAPKAANGGQVQPAGVNFLELVVVKNSKDAGDNPVVVFITDGHGKKLSSAGATGTATLLSGKDKAVVTLTPDGDNRMKGTGKYASNPTMKAIVAITLPGKPTDQARFTPLAADDGHDSHKH
jgi:hypothetical protein